MHHGLHNGELVVGQPPPPKAIGLLPPLLIEGHGKDEADDDEVDGHEHDAKDQTVRFLAQLRVDGERCPSNEMVV